MERQNTGILKLEDDALETVSGGKTTYVKKYVYCPRCKNSHKVNLIVGSYQVSYKSHWVGADKYLCDVEPQYYFFKVIGQPVYLDINFDIIK